MTLIKGASRGNVNTNVPQRQVTPEIQGTRECGVGRSGHAHDLHSGRPLLLLLRRITERATPRSPVVALPSLSRRSHAGRRRMRAGLTRRRTIYTLCELGTRRARRSRPTIYRRSMWVGRDSPSENQAVRVRRRATINARNTPFPPRNRIRQPPASPLWSRVAGFQIRQGLRARPPVEDWPDVSRRSHLDVGGSNRGEA